MVRLRVQRRTRFSVLLRSIRPVPRGVPAGPRTAIPVSSPRTYTPRGCDHCHSADKARDNPPDTAVAQATPAPPPPAHRDRVPTRARGTSPTRARPRAPCRPGPRSPRPRARPADARRRGSSTSRKSSRSGEKIACEAAAARELDPAGNVPLQIEVLSQAVGLEIHRKGAPLGPRELRNRGDALDPPSRFRLEMVRLGLGIDPIDHELHGKFPLIPVTWSERV